MRKTKGKLQSIDKQGSFLESPEVSTVNKRAKSNGYYMKSVYPEGGNNQATVKSAAEGRGGKYSFRPMKVRLIIAIMLFNYYAAISQEKDSICHKYFFSFEYGNQFDSIYSECSNSETAVYAHNSEVSLPEIFEMFADSNVTQVEIYDNGRIFPHKLFEYTEMEIAVIWVEKSTINGKMNFDQLQKLKSLNFVSKRTIIPGSVFNIDSLQQLTFGSIGWRRSKMNIPEEHKCELRIFKSDIIISRRNIEQLLLLNPEHLVITELRNVRPRYRKLRTIERITFYDTYLSEKEKRKLSSLLPNCSFE